MDTPTTEPVAPEDDAIMPDEQSSAAAQSPNDETVAAATPAEPTNTNTDEEPAEEADNSEESDSEYANLKEWADKKGFDLTTEEGQAKAWKSMREAEKRMHDSTVKASSLEKTIGEAAKEADVVNEDSEWQQRVKALELKDSVNTFFTQDGIDKDMRPKMAEYASANPNVSYLVESGYLTISDLYNMVRGADPTLAAQLKAKGGKEALEKVVSKQQAKAVPGAATNSDLADNTPEDAFLKAFEAN